MQSIRWVNYPLVSLDLTNILPDGPFCDDRYDEVRFVGRLRNREPRNIEVAGIQIVI